MTTPEPLSEVQIVRRTVKGWTDQARKVEAARRHTADKRAAAMLAAFSMGIPLRVIADDADVDPSFVSRAVSLYCDRHGIEHPTTTRRKKENA